MRREDWDKVDYLDPKQNWGAEPLRQPAHQEDEAVLFSECGRILDCDYRSHWFKITKPAYEPHQILVRHGGGDERFSLNYVTGRNVVAALALLDSDRRYLLMHALFNIYSDGRRKGREEASDKFRRAFVDGRLKKRKVRGQDKVKVYIEAEYVKTAPKGETGLTS